MLNCQWCGSNRTSQNDCLPFCIQPTAGYECTAFHRITLRSLHFRQRHFTHLLLLCRYCVEVFFKSTTFFRCLFVCFLQSLFRPLCTSYRHRGWVFHFSCRVSILCANITALNSLYAPVEIWLPVYHCDRNIFDPLIQLLVGTRVEGKFPDTLLSGP